MIHCREWMRVRVARALCQRSGADADRLIGGQPAWHGFLADADSLLLVLVPPDAWDAPQPEHDHAVAALLR